MHLSAESIALGTQLQALGSVGSTNAEAFVAARAGAKGPLWVTAEQQTSGRGRRGRVWHSPPGNLYASLLLMAPSPPAKAAQLSFVSGLALYDAVTDAAQGARARLQLKWPNDLLLDGAKVAGILIEGEEIAGIGQAVVIGLGVNCLHHPADTPYPTASLSSFGVTREALFQALTRAMAERLAEWAGGKGFVTIRSAWLTRAAGVGMPIRVRTGEHEIEGTFGSIDGEGGLVLSRGDGGIQVISAGEIMRFGALGPGNGTHNDNRARRAEDAR